MMRKTPAVAMQKTYDECYLICSTAIYFEGQNNEAEALRAWRNALDQIYYHNAYKMPLGYAPRTETEKALQDSLRSMELQCKERVDLLEALKKSRQEAEEDAKAKPGDAPTNKSRESLASVHTAPANGQSSGSWRGLDTVPQARYSDLPRQPALPSRPAPSPGPSYRSKASYTNDASRSNSMQSPPAPHLAPPTPTNVRSRTPSPEKKTGGMLKTLRSNPKDRTSSGRSLTSLRTRPPPAAAKAATYSWSGQQRPPLQTNGSSSAAGSSTPAGNAWDPYTRTLVERGPSRDYAPHHDDRRTSASPLVQPPSPSDYKPQIHRHNTDSFEDLGKAKSYPLPYPDYPNMDPYGKQAYARSEESVDTARPAPPPVPMHRPTPPPNSSEKMRRSPPNLSQIGSSSLSYMKEYPNHPPQSRRPAVPGNAAPPARSSDSEGQPSSSRKVQAKPSPTIPRKAVGRAAGLVSAIAERQKLDNLQSPSRSTRDRGIPHPGVSELPGSSPDASSSKKTAKRKIESKPIPPHALTPPTTDESPDSDSTPDSPTAQQAWDRRVAHLMKNLPKGVDEGAAKQIFNEIVIKGDEVHWDDVAGLEIAKSALKETVVYPFLRPDLFLGLREPARGMLLFGPPGTGKTMLARAVATESKSVFFAISASSLTSKYLGESEKLVRALFCLAKELAPSIIFVDEIDSLLGARGGSSEHEATRRIKTEFLIQWSDLQKAAAGRETTTGDATRVLVLAATNLPWAIDEAARRRFVRRQYIPLPEAWVREKQLRTLLSAQKQGLKDRDLEVLVELTDGFSGSDITALAKDAAMGPLRALGERLLHMAPDEIRPIQMRDFEASLVNIRPSVSKAGLKEFEDWAREFGERGG